MHDTAPKAVLITGANAGIGREAARQLALGGTTAKIYLACRNPQRAQTARRELEASTGRSIFEVILMDVSDLESVRSAVAALPGAIDTLIMNAGGGGGRTPAALTADGVTTIFAVNVLGHVVLLEEMISQHKLTEGALYVGSEAARGIPKLRQPRPAFATHSVDELASVIDASWFGDAGFETRLGYGQAKYLAALWMGALARVHPQLRLITVSPGNTAGTNDLDDQPLLTRILMRDVARRFIAPALGLVHPLQEGARRIVDAITNPGLQSGRFYASAADAVTGVLVDQATIFPDLANPVFQDNADRAIHRFLDRPA